VNRSLKIPTGFHLPAQGCSNPGHRVVMHPQPQRGCVIIRSSHGHNPVRVDKNQSRDPRVARRSQPWALYRNPVGIAQTTIPNPVPTQHGGGSEGRCVNRPLKIPTGFHPPAQGCSNPGHRVAVDPQPQWDCAIVSPPQGRNPGGVDDDQSRGPRVARASQPWALFRNPLGIAQTITLGKLSNKPTTPTGLCHPT
jgi:hypothetical protein